MELTKEQIAKIEELFDCDISEMSNFSIATFIAGENNTLPDFEHNIGKYFDIDSIGISYKDDVKDVRFERYTVKADTKKETIEKYNKYIETQFKIMQAIMDINSDFYKTVEGDFTVHADAHIDGFDTNFEYSICKIGDIIEIKPITIISI